MRPQGSYIRRSHFKVQPSIDWEINVNPELRPFRPIDHPAAQEVHSTTTRRNADARTQLNSKQRTIEMTRTRHQHLQAMDAIARTLPGWAWIRLQMTWYYLLAERENRENLALCYIMM